MDDVDAVASPMSLKPIRRVHFHDPDAPSATVVVPSAFVAVRNGRGQLLLVRRADSGMWELPGGRVNVGEDGMQAAVRETVEESGVQVRITGLVGLFTDPGHIVESPAGDETRQQFVVCYRAWALHGRPQPDEQETTEAAWFELGDVATLPTEPWTRLYIRHALSGVDGPHLG